MTTLVGGNSHPVAKGATRVGHPAVTTESEEIGLPGLLKTSQTAGHEKTLYPFSFDVREPRLVSNKRTWGRRTK
jgi:hypothetical protein